LWLLDCQRTIVNDVLNGKLVNDVLNVVSYEKAGNKGKLDELINSKIVLVLKDDVKVHALEWSIERKMIKIKFEDSKGIYWVNDGALKHIKAGD
jgi:hypothetical protein